MPASTPARLAGAVGALALAGAVGFAVFTGGSVNVAAPPASASPSPTATASAEGSPGAPALGVLGDCATTVPASDVAVAAITTSGPPAYAVAAAGSVWVATTTAGTVDRIDPETNAVIQSIEVAEPSDAAGGSVMALVADGDDVWAAVDDEQSEPRLVRIDSAANAVVDAIPIPFRAYHMLISAGSGSASATVWISDFDTGQVGVVDLAEKRLSQQRSLTGGTVQMAAGPNGSVYTPNNGGSTVTRMTNETTSLDFDAIVTVERPVALAAARSGIWGVNGRGKLFLLDPTTNRLAALFDAAGTPNHLASNDDLLFVNAYPEGAPAELMAVRDAGLDSCIVGRFPYPASADGPWMLSFAEGSVWAGNQATDTVVRFTLP